MITENTLRVKIEGTNDGTLKASVDGATQSVTALDAAQQAQAATATKATVALQENAAAAAAVGVAAQESSTAVVAAAAVAGESYDQQGARLKAAIALSLQQQAANSGIAESEASIVERAGLRTESTAAQITATRAAVAAQDAQMVSMKGFAAAEAEATAATTRDTAAKVANTEATLINGGVAREVGVLVGEVARGNYTRLEGSTITLANRTGLLQQVFTGEGLAIAGVVASIGLLVAIGVHAVSQQDELSRAIAATGNHADVTTYQLKGMASQLQSSGASYGQSIDVLAKIVASGKVAHDSLQTAGQAAVDMAALTGQSMDSAVQAVVRLGQDPVAAAASLNDEFHFLTAAQNEQIISLEASGNKADAAKVAFDALGAVMHARAMQAKEDAPWFTTAFNNFKQGWSNIGAGVGEIVTLGGKKTEIDQYTDAVKKYNAAVKQLEMDRANGRTGIAHDLNVSTAQSAYNNVMDIWNSPDFQKERDQKQINAVVQSVQDDGVAATATLAKLGITLDGMKDKQTKVNEAAAALYKAHLAGVNFPGINFNGATADTPQGAGWDAIVAKLDPKKKAKAPGADPFAGLDRLVQSAQVFDNGVGGDKAQTEQVTKILAIADAGAKLIASGHDVAKVQAEVATGVAALNEGYAKQADILKQQNVEALKTYQEAIDQQIADKQKQIDLQVASIGLGTKEVQQQQELAAIYATVDKTIEQLNRARAQKGANVDYIDGEIAAQKASIPILVAQEKAKFAAMDAAQADWSHGATSALQNYVDRAADVASQTRDLFTTAFNGMGDSLASFVTTGKGNFSSLIDSILSDLIKMEARILVSQVLQSVLGAFMPAGGASYDLGGNGASFSSDMASVGGGSYGMLGAGHATGGRIVGAGTGTSDSIIARLSNGENVMTAKATDYYGQAFMDNVNNMRLPRFADGGRVGGGSSGAGGMGQPAPQIIVNNNTDSSVKASSQQQPDGRWITKLIIDTVSGDIAGGGKSAKSMEGRYGLSRRGVPVSG